MEYDLGSKEPDSSALQILDVVLWQTSDSEDMLPLGLGFNQGDQWVM